MMFKATYCCQDKQITIGSAYSWAVCPNFQGVQDMIYL